MATIESNLQAVRGRIAQACDTVGRDVASVQLLAVSKTFGASALAAAYQAGQHAFGENYAQEAVDKITAFNAWKVQHAPAGPPVQWHFIGPLQSNKTRLVAGHFDWVHSIDRLKTAERLSEQRDAHLPPLQACIQVNVSGEASKSGVTPAELPVLARAVSVLPRLKLRGLMCIPEPAQGQAAQRMPFALLRDLQLQLQQSGLELDTLSMGMTADLEAAIAEGASIVRVGTAIFGSRTT
jgi:pyridoxal phosphate enzyme (YggS family)